MLEEKVYYSISEISKEFDVTPSALRFWEKQFSFIKPDKNKRGVRLYRKQDVENIRKIVYLTREKKLTLDGVRKEFKNMRIQGDNDEILQTLMETKQFLLQLKENLN
ncbi:MAG: MerR family transcriptional regulator [Bacteroidales bacterium]|nr:MerR family transcriptional regulator [Bacteroidales bacterium]